MLVALGFFWIPGAYPTCVEPAPGTRCSQMSAVHFAAEAESYSYRTFFQIMPQFGSTSTTQLVLGLNNTRRKENLECRVLRMT
jgi:hypothetical protein